jgi:opacity protein-like surface antigen
MKTRFARAAVVGALLAAGGAHAQDFETYRPKQTMTMFNYEMSSPIGSFKDDFVSDTSWRGFSFEARSMVKPRLSVGIGFNFNRYDQTYDELTQNLANGGTLSGPVYRYADQLAIKGLIHYYLREGQPLQPYIGAGIGGAWTYAFAQSADLANSDDGFDFIVSPEAGLTFTAAHGASSLGLNAAIRYNYSTADFLQVDDAQSVTVVVGIFGAY